MSAYAQAQVEHAPRLSFTPVRSGLLQGKCACGGTPGADGECAECRRKRLRHHLAPSATPSTVPRSGHHFSRIRTIHAGEASTPPATRVSLPPLEADESTIFVNQPLTGGSKAPVAPSPTGDSCAVPFAMTKVTSGPFQGGYTMDDYFPQHKGKGLWSHPDTAGTFDTGKRAGSNVQLFGTFPSPCRPELFSLAQTVTHDKAVFDGVRDPDEGKTIDDIAASKSDASRPPFRRDWLGGGYNVSMADPPSLLYSAVRSAEWDRTFVTSLIGSGGRASVTWQTSIRVVNGKLTRNAVT